MKITDEQILDRILSDDLGGVDLYSESQSEFWNRMMLFFKDYKMDDLLREYYKAAILQFISICKNEERRNKSDTLWHEIKCCGELNIFDVLQKCKAFYKKLVNREMAITLNRFAKEWDVEIKRRHSSPDPSHFFLVLPSDRKYCYSRMYHNDSEPDTRLIFIFVTTRGRYDERIMICLHEMGHFIGCRKRRDRIELYIMMCVMSLIHDIYLNYCCKLFHIDKGSFSPSLTTNPVYSRYLRKTAYLSRLKLEQGYEEFYHLISDLVRKKINTYENENLDKEWYAKYLKKLHQMVWEVIKENEKQICMIVSSNCGDQQQIGDELVEAVHETIISIEKKTDIDSSKEEMMRCDFIERVDSLMSETAADIFMLKISNMTNGDKYLRLILSEALRTWVLNNADSSDGFVRFIASDLIRLRVIAVLYSLNMKICVPKKKFYVCSGMKAYIDAYRVIDNMLRKYVDTEKELVIRRSGIEEKYNKDTAVYCTGFEYSVCKEQDIWNMQEPLISYCKSINGDRLYLDIDAQEYGNTVVKLRNYMTKNWLGWIVRFCSYRIVHESKCSTSVESNKNGNTV